MLYVLWAASLLITGLLVISRGAFPWSHQDLVQRGPIFDDVSVVLFFFQHSPGGPLRGLAIAAAVLAYDLSLLVPAVRRFYVGSGSWAVHLVGQTANNWWHYQITHSHSNAA
jgi:hypothetical protein